MVVGDDPVVRQLRAFEGGGVEVEGHVRRILHERRISGSVTGAWLKRQRKSQKCVNSSVSSLPGYLTQV